jgi:hypothetical protein
MPIPLDDLCPYRSLLLATCPYRWGLPAAVEEIRQYAQVRNDVDHVEVASPIAIRHGLKVAYFHYRVSQSPAWLLTQQVVNSTHELVVVFRRGTSIAILATESRMRERILGHFDLAHNAGIGALSAIPAATLNAAYVRGKISLLWLTGTHRHVPSQVDNKAIAGTDLLYALDPLGDQSFFFTSAVSKLPLNAYRYKVGVSPHRSYVWAGPSDDADTLCQGVAALFNVLQNAPAPITNPLPMLAAPAMDAATVAAIANAYEAALLPSEILDYDLPALDRAEAERWSRLSFDILALNNADFGAAISLVHGDGTTESLGQIQLTFDLTRPSRITWIAASLGAAPANQQLQQDAIEVINSRRHWLKVWYESGHTLVDQKFFVSGHIDPPFSFCFTNFANFDVRKEKPHPFTVANIGASDSLFCWTRQRWHRQLPQAANVSGWLACNDGSMEIADFIHFEVVNGQPELTLIHVKAGKFNGAPGNRQLSVSDYEIVVGQAIKNLRYLDLQHTIADFTAALNQKLMNASWLAGVQDTRANMLAAMNAAGELPRRRVVIVQPRVRQSALNAARAAPQSPQGRIAKQLDTLLFAARANCQSLGAEFVVIADQN